MEFKFSKFMTTLSGSIIILFFVAIAFAPPSYGLPPSTGGPIELEGTILGPAERAAAISVLGVTPDPATEIVAFDLAPAISALCDNPNTFAIEDDGIPISGPDISGGPFTGVDVDAVAGKNNSGASIFATNVSFASFGPKIAPLPNSSGGCLNTVIDGLFGDTEAEGFPENVLGPPDAVTIFGCDPAGFSGFTSIGSGGILEVVFADPLTDSNIVGNFDLFLFDAGGAGDNATFTVDVLRGIIYLTPELAFNRLGTTHTVSALLEDASSDPIPGVNITFDVINGPNSGENGIEITDANGEAEFVYKGDGGAGVDQIFASFIDPQCGAVNSNVALKFWDNDCNENEIPDTCDIDCSSFNYLCANFSGCGGSIDDNGDNVPDECNSNPVCDGAVADTGELWPPNHKMSNIEVIGVTDPDGDPIEISITAIAQDEPVDIKGGGDGNTSPDAIGVGDNAAQIRAERQGGGNGRVYEISFTATDPSGGECSGSVRVCVPHDQRVGHVCVDDGQDYDSTRTN